MVWPGPSSRASRIAPAMLMPVEPPRHRPSSWTRSKTIGKRLLIRNLVGEIGREAFEIGGDAALADAFGDRAPSAFSSPFGVEAVERRAQRIGERDLDVRVASPSARARRRPACRRCRPRRRSRRPCRRSAPRFPAPWCATWPSRLATLSNWLAQIAPFGSLFASCVGKPARHLHVIVGVLVGHRRNLDQLGAEQPQRVLLFLALRIGNDDDGAIAERLGDQRRARCRYCRPCPRRSTPPGRSRPRFSASRMMNSAGAVLDRLAGIHELGLAENLAAGLLRRALEPDQRRVADRIDHRTVHECPFEARCRATLETAGRAFKAGIRVERPRPAGFASKTRQAAQAHAHRSESPARFLCSS